MAPLIYLAPMAGVTDLAFRLICRKFGAKHCSFEMIHCNSIVYSNYKNTRLLKTIKKDSPVSAQLLGADPVAMLDAAQYITGSTDITFMDINSACPSKKIVKKGEGAALLDNKRALGKIIKKLSSGLKIPVTVKLRTGYRKSDKRSCVKAALTCQDNGASIVFIHGRTQAQGYSGPVDYELIRAVKQALRIPVFGSGNIFNCELAKKMLDETGCDGILVARGAQGSPWIFRDIENYFKKGTLPKAPSLSIRKKALKEHLTLIEKYCDIPKESKLGFTCRMASYYTKGFPGAAAARGRIFRVKSVEELLNFIEKL